MLVAGVVSPVALISAPTLVAVTRFERRRAAAECDPAGMNHLGDANLRGGGSVRQDDLPSLHTLAAGIDRYRERSSPA
ncbi:hypothetical protein ACOZDE_25285 [Streptomyces griseoincarnatus]